MKCYHLELMLSSGTKCYHLELMLSSGTNGYHLGWNVIIWVAMLSSGANVIIWDKMISCGANVIMLSFAANVIICCYLVMLSSGMITPPYFIFPENFTHSADTLWSLTRFAAVAYSINFLSVCVYMYKCQENIYFLYFSGSCLFRLAGYILQNDIYQQQSDSLK